MSKKVIAKNIFLGLFVLVYGAGIILGGLSGSFSSSETSISSVTSTLNEATSSLEGRVVIVVVFLWLVGYFILEAMTRKEESKINDILHFLLGSEMLFFGGFSLLQGGEIWLWLFMIVGIASAISFSFKAKKWEKMRANG